MKKKWKRKKIIGVAVLLVACVGIAKDIITSNSDVTLNDAYEVSVNEQAYGELLIETTPATEYELTVEPARTAESAGESTDTAIPAYAGESYVVLNDNLPYFSEEEYSMKSYEYYSGLDDLGRAGMVIACIGEDLMPTAERGEIGMIKPSGWVQNKYEWVDGKYLYNRCHLIGYQLTGENANEKNLITGTRSFNVDGMLPFENMVANYVRGTGNHVMYRVTPIYDKDNLLADGVQMEAISVEDDGAGICFNVFVYNVEPGVEIDYATGENWAAM